MRITITFLKTTLNYILCRTPTETMKFTTFLSFPNISIFRTISSNCLFTHFYKGHCYKVVVNLQGLVVYYYCLFQERINSLRRNNNIVALSSWFIYDLKTSICRYLLIQKIIESHIIFYSIQSNVV